MKNKEKWRNERKILGRKQMGINVKMAIFKINRGKTITQKKICTDMYMNKIDVIY